MFTTLLESNRRNPRAAAQGFLSLAFHVALGVGAVQATRRVVTSTPIRVIPMGPIVAIHRPTPPVVQPTSTATSTVQLPDNPVFAPPPVVPIVGIPPAQIGEPIDPSRFVVGSPTPPSCGLDCRSADSESGSVFREELVDEPATVVAQAAPIYPPILKAAAVEGRVVFLFVVDTLGSVEPGSVRTIEVTNSAFEASARDAVLGSRFKPARIRGEAVRQLVRQGISFRIER